MKPITFRKLWAGLVLMLLLSPLGLMLPGLFQADGAWGEWGAQELRVRLGYVPAKLAQLEGVWKSVLPAYAIPGLNKPWQVQLAYLGSGFLGAGLVGGLTFGFARWVTMTGRKHPRDPERLKA
jgi:hypothetical protein